MSICFVIQPFDRGPFDKRYDDVIAPAIADAGLEPYRVDRDPAASVLIDSIEQGIKSSAMCVADITSENPNVWYELGFAFAAGKQVVMLCAKERLKFPFDVQHRSILVYSTESSSDFEQLRSKLTERLKAGIRKNDDLATLAAPRLREEGGLAPHEVACLAVIMENTLGQPTVPIHNVLRDMEQAGFNGTAVGVAVRSLARKKLVLVSTEADRDGEPYNVYCLTDAGGDWLVAHQEDLTLEVPDRDPPARGGSDEIPF